MPCLGADDPVWRICSLKLLFCRASSVSILNTSFLQDFGWWDTFPGRQTLLDPNNTPWHRTNRPWRPMGHPWQRIVKHFGLLDFRCVPSLTQDMTKNISSQTGISFPFQTPSTRVGISISKHPCSTLYIRIYIYICLLFPIHPSNPPGIGHVWRFPPTFLSFDSFGASGEGLSFEVGLLGGLLGSMTAGERYIGKMDTLP